jgi:GLPGLI family protein
MKKNNLTILFMLFCFIAFTQNNSGVITYKKDMYKRYQGVAKKFEEYRKTRPKFFNSVMDMESKAYLLAKEVNFYLKFKNNESIFKAENLLEIENNISYGLVLGPLGSGKYYTNIKKNENITQLNAYGELFLIKNEPLKWKLINETKKIGKYICYKATTTKITNGSKGEIKYPVIAWYTPKIPVHFGPLGFYGLPGLIINLEVYGVNYYVTGIKLNPIKKIKIKKPTHGKLVTKKQFDKIGTSTMKNFKKGF